MRIGIVNDLRLVRETLRRLVESIPGKSVAWLANDGQEAIDRAREQTPDLILMDLIMPGVDGVEATRRIMSQSPCPILVVTSSVSGNISRVYEAMGFGALDAVDTPVLAPGGRIDGDNALRQKIDRIERMSGRPRTPSAVASAPAPPVARSGSTPPSLIAIGSSTGGPKALAQLLGALPKRLSVPVVIVQHVDSNFAGGLATWLSAGSPLPVVMADEGAAPEPGKVHLARTESHLVLGPDRRFRYTTEPRDCFFTPSVDAFFHSAVRHWPSTGAAVLLTGMGRDGAEGLLALRRARWLTLAQDQASSSIWGMPRAAVELGAPVHVLPPDQIGALLAECCPANR